MIVAFRSAKGTSTLRGAKRDNQPPPIWEGEAPAEPQDSFLNHRGHRGHRVARPDALSVSLWLKEGFLIGAGRSGMARQEPRPPRVGAR